MTQVRTDLQDLIPWDTLDVGQKAACVNPDCGSSDAAKLFTRTDGRQGYKCFSCNTFVPAPGGEKKEKGKQSPLDPLKRGIVEATVRKFQVSTPHADNVEFPYTNGKKKTRYGDKKFSWGGGGKECGFFGQDTFPPDPTRTLILTEGEYDAMAAYQMLEGKYPVVSIPNGAAGALKDCTTYFEYLDGFKEVVLCFDNDKPGTEAAAAVACLLMGKVRVFPHRGDLKDANDYLIANQRADFVSRFYAAATPKAVGIVGIAEAIQMMDEKIVPVTSFPFDGLNSVLGGIFEKRLYMLLAGSGSGKSTLMRQIAYKIWRDDKEAKLGMMFLEESPAQTIRGLLGAHSGKSAILTEKEQQILGVSWGDGEYVKVKGELAEGNRFHFWNCFEESQIDPGTVLAQMRYMVRALGVKYIFLDHISLVMSGSATSDERREIDSFMTKLRKFVEATGVVLFAVNHLTKAPMGKGHEEGARVRLADARGSGAIYQLSDVVLGIERDQQAASAEAVNRVVYRVLKNRPTATLGIAAVGVYNKTEDRVVESAHPGSLGNAYL